jgi:ribosome-associated protein
MIEIPGGPAIPDEELLFTATRGGGPGGQHVNKVATRIELWFDVAASPSLTPSQKEAIRRRLRTRISAAGVLRVVAQASRSQTANRTAAVARFVDLLAEALRRETPRVATRVSKSAKGRRVDEKKARARIKTGRGRVPAED